MGSKRKTPFHNRFLIFLGCFFVSTIIYWNVSSLYATDKVYSTSSNEAVYVMDDISIDYRYDTSKYEVVPLISEPYAVLKGDKATLNRMKWSKEKPVFYIDLRGKLPGTYQEVVQYENIPENLTVEIYPLVVNLRLMEQQTLTFTPQIELIGTEKLSNNYIVSLPELGNDEVKVKGMQETLNNIGSIRGVIDVSKRTKTFEAEVVLQAYDRDGNVMPDVNILEKTITVRVPITKRVIVNEKVINEIVVIENKDEVSESGKKDEKPTNKTSKPNSSQEATKDNASKETSKEPPKEGVLSFINIPKGMKLENLTPDLTWSFNVKIDLKGFEAGVYEMPIKDQGKVKVLKFHLIQLDNEEPADSSTKDDSESSGANEDNTKDSSHSKSEGEGVNGNGTGRNDL